MDKDPFNEDMSTMSPDDKRLLIRVITICLLLPIGAVFAISINSWYESYSKKNMVIEALTESLADFRKEPSEISLSNIFYGIREKNLHFYTQSSNNPDDINVFFKHEFPDSHQLILDNINNLSAIDSNFSNCESSSCKTAEYAYKTEVENCRAKEDSLDKFKERHTSINDIEFHNFTCFQYMGVVLGYYRFACFFQGSPVLVNTPGLIPADGYSTIRLPVQFIANNVFTIAPINTLYGPNDIAPIEADIENCHNQAEQKNQILNRALAPDQAVKLKNAVVIATKIEKLLRDD